MSYLSPALSELSSAVSPADVDKNDSKAIEVFVVGCNNEHSSRHLLPTSEPLKRITFGSEGNAPSICLNALNESLQIAFPNNVLISKFHDECG